MSQSVANSILITGGAGYIGSHIVKALSEKNAAANIVVMDNLSTGFANCLPKAVKLVVADILDQATLSAIIQKEKISTVIHLAAKTVIPESIEKPQDYYLNNTVGTLNLLRACIEHKVSHFIYSSTAAVYGMHPQDKISEQSQTLPNNPYGHSKLMSEQMLKDVANSSALKYVILRYFNVAGAAIDGSIGQQTPKATHLIKVAAQTACGLLPALSIFGDDYPTPDGTCIRDFIHVSDLAQAHLDALRYLQEDGQSCTLNCGYGHGYSVKEVIKAVEEITNKPLPVNIASKREGDLACVIADNSQIKQVLKWKPEFDDISVIVKTALEWERRNISLK
ncbi:MAG: UDP-glucose 4-epimerase GalE [Proteobacteria bacterium]|nr:UDP-glucose 4-epimerase GalE [Pseudomonadota bacterium]